MTWPRSASYPGYPTKRGSARWTGSRTWATVYEEMDRMTRPDNGDAPPRPLVGRRVRCWWNAHHETRSKGPPGSTLDTCIRSGVVKIPATKRRIPGSIPEISSTSV